MQTQTVAFHWSGGKDSALALSRLLARDDVVVDRLVTTTHPEREQSTVHGLPVALLQAQAASIGIPLQIVPLPGAGLEGYVDVMAELAVRLRADGIDAFAFGDLSCSGVLEAKQEQFAPAGIEVIEPLWGLSSAEVIEEFLASGISSVTVVVDAAVLAADHVGVAVDRDFVDKLPAGCDPCGEFGEYHTFAHDGPLFHRPIEFSLSPVRHLERTIGTTDGPRTYAYWLATPEPATVAPAPVLSRPAPGTNGDPTGEVTARRSAAHRRLR